MQDRLSQTFAALSDPTRRAMLAQLSKGEANVSELAKPFLKSMSLPAVTKHVKVLEKAGLRYFDSFYRCGALVFGGGHVILPVLKTEVVQTCGGEPIDSAAKVNRSKPSVKKDSTK